MNAYTTCTLHNIALMALVGFCCWLFNSGWPLLGLVFVMGTETKK